MYSTDILSDVNIKFVFFMPIMHFLSQEYRIIDVGKTGIKCIEFNNYALKVVNSTHVAFSQVSQIKRIFKLSLVKWFSNECHKTIEITTLSGLLQILASL